MWVRAEWKKNAGLNTLLDLRWAGSLWHQAQELHFSNALLQTALEHSPLGSRSSSSSSKKYSYSLCIYRSQSVQVHVLPVGQEQLVSISSRGEAGGLKQEAKRHLCWCSMWSTLWSFYPSKAKGYPVTSLAFSPQHAFLTVNLLNFHLFYIRNTPRITQIIKFWFLFI